jgi:hypothetical protein
MSDCPNMRSCRLFPLFKMAGALQVWKINYCTSNFQACERYKQVCSAESVPDTMLPNGKLLKLEK